jgi:hypothetical protein
MHVFISEHCILRILLWHCQPDVYYCGLSASLTPKALERERKNCLRPVSLADAEGLGKLELLCPSNLIWFNLLLKSPLGYTCHYWFFDVYPETFAHTTNCPYDICPDNIKDICP